MALSDNLSVYYALENVNDSVGSNNLTNNNSVTFSTGKVSNAGYFTLAGVKYLSLASTGAVQTGDIDFTIQAWVYMDTVSGLAFPIIVSKDNNAANSEYALYYDSTASRFAFLIYKSGGVSAAVVATAFGAPSATTWYHLVAWHDAAADTVNLAINDTTPASAATGGAAQAAGSAEFRISGRQRDNRQFDGRIDEVGLWKRVLTGAEITDLYNSGNGRDYAYITAGATGHPTALRQSLFNTQPFGRGIN